MFLGSSSAISSSEKTWNFLPFSSALPNSCAELTQPRPWLLGCSPFFCQYPVLILTSFIGIAYHKRLPNLVNDYEEEGI